MVDFLWHLIGGELVREGRPPPREGLVYGQYLPEAAGVGIGGTGSNFGVTGVTCGLSDSSALTDYNASSTQTLTLASGTTITDKTIYGDIRPSTTHGQDIVLTNCLLRGGPHVPSAIDAVVKADQSRTGTGKIILIDCEIWPQLACLNREGTRGNRIEIYRTWIHDVIDGLTPYATTSQNSGQARARMYGSIVERLRYHYPDYVNGVSGAAWHSDGTHNDCVAISGGKDIIIKGNLLMCNSVDLPGTGTNPTHPQLQATGHAYGAGVIITNTVSNPLDNTVIVEENWLWGGKANFNIKPDMVCIVRNNRHYREAPVISSDSQFWWRYDLRAGNGVVADNSTWVNGPYIGQVLTEPRDLGVHFNA